MTVARLRDVSEIWELVQRFQDTDREYFSTSLAKHEEVVLFRVARTRELVGFAAIDVMHHALPPRGNLATILFTSNVVIDPEYRGHNLIQRAGARTFLRTRLRHPRRPIFWLFDSFSYKSYLLMGRNFATYWPHPGRVLPEHVRQFRDEVAARYYGDAWDAKNAIVRRSNRKRLREETAPIGPRELEDPLVRHFVKLNPHHREGDMLVCIAPLDHENWLAVARRAMARLAVGTARSISTQRLKSALSGDDRDGA